MKNIVFDLGGVVVDWSPQRVLNEFPGDRELPESLFLRGFFQKYWQNFDKGLVTQQELVRQMSEFSGRTEQECFDFVEYIKHSLVDIPETVELIRRLSAGGYRLYCLSNMSAEFYDYLKVREVFSYFDGQIISAHEKTIKPEEAIYRRLIDRYDLVPEESLFIDDLEANIQAAGQLGLNTVLFADREEGFRNIRQLLNLSGN